MENLIRVHDFVIKELPKPINDLLQVTSLPWLNSLEFCTLYVPNPAEYILLKMDDETIHQVVFYRLIKKMSLLIIEMIGFPEVIEQDIQALMKIHHAHLAIYNHLENPVKPEQEWHSDQTNVYFKSYVTVVNLPQSKDDYMNALGKNKRKQLPQYLRRLNNHFDNRVEIRYDIKNDIALEDVIQLECLNRERRASRGKGVESKFAIQKRQERRWALTKAMGLLVTLRYRGKIIGGTLTYLYGNEALMIVTAHDKAFESLRIGTIGVWKTIGYLIDKGYAQCNFLWGRKVYKTQFLGIEYPWSVHIISSYQWLVIIWKLKMSFDDFYFRAWQLSKTRLSIFFSSLMITNYE
jgi:hypothetical protein